jgi:hypothetical protein
MRMKELQHQLAASQPFALVFVTDFEQELRSSEQSLRDLNKNARQAAIAAVETEIRHQGQRAITCACSRDASDSSRPLLTARLFVHRGSGYLDGTTRGKNSLIRGTGIRDFYHKYNGKQALCRRNFPAVFCDQWGSF